MSSANSGGPSGEPARKASSHLAAAVLLALAGGGVDAYIYLHHGHVFAAAMTGNGVLFGADVLHRDWTGAWHHLVPLVAFSLGVMTSLLLSRKLKDASILFGLSGEVLLLFAVAWLPAGFPSFALVTMVSFAMAYQVAAFRKVDAYAFNSTFITGDLRSALEGLDKMLDPQTRHEGLRHFRDLGLVVLAFLAGAAIGAELGSYLGNRTLMVMDLPLLAVLGLVIRRHARKRAAGYALTEEPPASGRKGVTGVHAGHIY